MTSRLLRKTNPLARLAASMLVTLPLLVSLDWVSPTVVLVGTVVFLLLDGTSIASLLRRIWPLLIVAPLAGLTMLFYAKPSGRIWWHFLTSTISDGSIALAIAMMLRTLAMTVPVLFVATTIDATELADSLAQLLKIPARWVWGVFAGMRMVGLFVADWRALEQARRARGLGDRGRLRRWFSMSFALLVFAIRRGSKLATAMEARGFGAGPRSSARQATWRRADPIVLGLAIVLITGALFAAHAAGVLAAYGG